MTHEIVTTMLNCFEDILSERMYEQDDIYTIECLTRSVSPVVRIDYHNGIVLTINRDEYGYNEICRMTRLYGGECSVFIDGKDVFDWD